MLPRNGDDVKLTLSIATPSHVSIQMKPDGIHVTVGPPASNPAQSPTSGQTEIQPGWDHLVKREHVALLATFWHHWVPTVTDVTPNQAKLLWGLWCRDPRTDHRGVRFMQHVTNKCWLGYIKTN